MIINLTSYQSSYLFVCRTVLVFIAVGDQLPLLFYKYLSTSSQNHQLHCNFTLFVLIHYLHNLKSFNIILCNYFDCVSNSKHQKTCLLILVLYKKQKINKNRKEKIIIKMKKMRRGVRNFHRL
jgi:hypothetical protein